MSQLPAYLSVETSAMGRRWVSRDPAAERLGAAIAQRHDLPLLLGQVLAARQVPIGEVPVFLDPTLKALMPDPHLLRDAEAAAARLVQAVTQRQRVAVFGDYDVDGACATALVVEWLAHFGLAARAYIPDRIDEGYGPNVPAMAELGATHDLLIAVDCGTLAHEPIAAARAMGADVIVLDHHLAGETLPASTLVVNPNRADDDSGLGYLCAAGVVFMVLTAANRLLRQAGQVDVPNLILALDLVALATVADVAPLTGLNRAFVRQGLKVMAQGGRPGLRALAEVARLKGAPTAYHLGFVLGPRINAGGRVGQADLGVRLLLSSGAQAQEWAQMLDDYNGQRQAIERAVLDAAIAQIEARQGAHGPLVWAADTGWHPGVVGIVASRLKEKYRRPALVIGFDQGIGKGSGRSVEGVDLGRAVAQCVREGLLDKGGGHKMAAGLTVTEAQLGGLLARLSELLAAQGAGQAGVETLPIDGHIGPAGASLELVKQLELAGPFGAAAPAPRLVIANARLDHLAPMGDEHLRLTLSDGAGARLDAVAFRVADTPLKDFLSARQGQRLHLAGRLEMDDWNGRLKPKFRVEDAAGVP